MTDFTPTPEQTAIVDKVASEPTQSLCINALAGSAKTTTLALLQYPPGTTVLALAFNKLAADDLRAKLPPFAVVKTLNALGHAAWQTVISARINLNTRKTFNIVSNLAPPTHFSEVMAAINMAKTEGLVPDGLAMANKPLIPDTLESWDDIFDKYEIDLPLSHLAFARDGLRESIRQSYTGVIDFSDQLYMSACFNGAFGSYHTVLIDEAQDLSPINHRMLSMIKATRRIAVGDPNQSIYGFRGATENSMEQLTETFSMEPLPLTTCFRCCKEVVALAQIQRTPQMRPWDQAPIGEVNYWDSWKVSDIAELETATIICRNNAPLIRLAFRLLGNRVPVQMLGSDIGKAMLATLTKIIGKKAGNHIPIAQVIAKLTIWRNEEQEKALTKDKPYIKSRAEDRYDSFLAIIDGADCVSFGQLKVEITTLFAPNTAKVLLTTGHKSKGREWPIVIHYDPWRIPSKYAKKAANAGDHRQINQEFNLQYVITTRAQLRLIHMNENGEIE
tara:strand:- start:34453 stop:35961 length:1509 start_codon:yes stop_codon:yes gene_type:complete